MSDQAPLSTQHSVLSTRITVNGVRRTHAVEPRLLLVHYLRDVLGLTGTHVGCDTSQCGACTVLVDDEAVKSCTVLAVQVDGSRVTTIEGLEVGGRLHPLQEGFWEKHGLQCGFCTPGMIMTAVDLLQRYPSPTEAQVRHGLEGVLCRCTGYQNIVAAVRDAASRPTSATTVVDREATAPAAAPEAAEYTAPATEEAEEQLGGREPPPADRGAS